MSRWNGTINGLVISEAANPELYFELQKTSHRDRSNRLRALALVGLFALNNRVPAQQDSEPGQGGLAAGPVLVTKTEGRGTAAKKKIREKMLGSL
ncbi:hypothetical protein [Eoetvoesiella caeni]